MSELHLITFKCNDVELGVKITEIECIINVDTITKLANKHNHIKGMINLRNEVIPIIDLREFLSNEENQTFSDSCKVLIYDYITKEEKINKIGFIVDEIKNIIKKDLSESQKPELMNKNNYIEGILNVDDRLIMVINLALIVNEIIEDNWKVVENEQGKTF